MEHVRRFNKGDRVIHRQTKRHGSVDIAHPDTDYYLVHFCDGNDCFAHEQDLEFEDKADAFRSRLRKLFKEFNAIACIEYNGTEHWLSVGFGNKITTLPSEITADDI